MLGLDALGRLALGQKTDEVFGATVYEDSWHQPLSERVRYRKPMHTGAQQYSAFVQFEPFYESVTSDRWYVPFGEPTRFRPRLQTSLQQFASFVQFEPFYETVTADRWSPPLSEPSRRRKPMHTGAQQFAAFVNWQPIVDATFADRWAQPLSEPVRFRPRLIAAAQPFGRGIEIPITYSANQVSVTLLGTGTINGVPTSNYKLTLADNSRRILYTAVISPWSVSDRNA